MIEHTTLHLSGERFAVDYSIYGKSPDAQSIAEKICVEQTIEFPPELIQEDDIRGQIFGRVEEFRSQSDDCHHVTISYANEVSALNLPQLLNVVYGNVSLFPNVRVDKISLSRTVAALFKGPRFGINGLRKMFDGASGPVFMSALKPQGLSAKELAKQAHQFALGELDIVKDDHGLSNQVFSPFRERVQRCCEAVKEANAQTGGHTIYAPMLSSPSERIWEDALFAKEQGAGALLVSPSLIGFDFARRLAESDELAIPMLGHPAMIGSYVVSPTNGFSHYAMFGQVMRMIGMDASIFPNYGGRFSFSQQECKRVISGCTEEMNGYPSIFPAPGGGMTFENVPAMVDFYGNDVMYLMGGNLHKQSMPLAESCKRLRQLASNSQ